MTFFFYAYAKTKLKNIARDLMITKNTTFCLSAVLAFFTLSLTASAQYLEDFQTNQTQLFTFAAYDGNTSFTPEGLVVTIPAGTPPANPPGASFGGIAVAPVASVDLTGTTAIEVTARIDAGNASDLVLSIREGNGMGGDGEFFSFTIPSTSFTTAGFTTVSIDPTMGFFNGDMGNGGDGVLNGPLNNTGIQSPFGGSDAQNYTVQGVNFVGATVPEPGSLTLLMLALCPMLALRKRTA